MIVEPSNSWEVSYVLNIIRPDLDLDITQEELKKVITRDRAKQLSSWIKTDLDNRWIREQLTFLRRNGK